MHNNRLHHKSQPLKMKNSNEAIGKIPLQTFSYSQHPQLLVACSL